MKADEEIKHENDLILDVPQTDDDDQEGYSEDKLHDSQIAETLFSLTSVYNTLDEVDAQMLSKHKQNKLRAWKNHLWRSIEFYMSCLSDLEDHDDDE